MNLITFGECELYILDLGEIDQTQLWPSAIADYVPADHLAQFVVALARELLELSEVIGSYKSDLGQPPFTRRMMVALAALRLLLRALFVAADRQGLRRAGRFHDELRGARRARFSRTIADFRKRHLPCRPSRSCRC